jgi:phage terminase Nu1 subunit (DNA packaging protein)
MGDVNRSQLAKICGVSLTAVDNWVRRGCPHRRKGQSLVFDLVKVKKWRSEREASAPVPRNELQKAKTEIVQHKAHLLKLEMLEKYGVLVSAEAVAQELKPVFKAFQVALRALPTTLAKELWFFAKEKAPAIVANEISDQDGIAQIQAKLARPIDDCLRMLSKLNDWKNDRKKLSGERT